MCVCTWYQSHLSRHMYTCACIIGTPMPTPCPATHVEGTESPATSTRAVPWPAPSRPYSPPRPWACPGCLQPPPRPFANIHAYTHTSPYTNKEQHTLTDTAQDNRSCICQCLAPHPLHAHASAPRRRRTLACTCTHTQTHTPVLPLRYSAESVGQWATPCAASTARPSALMPHPASPPIPHQRTYEVQEGALHHTCYHFFILPPRLAQLHTDLLIHMPVRTRRFSCIHICRHT